MTVGSHSGSLWCLDVTPFGTIHSASIRKECSMELIEEGANPQFNEELVEAELSTECVGEHCVEHTTQEQLKNAHTGDLERDRVEAAQMGYNARAVDTTVAKAEARPPEFAKYSAVTAVDTTVAKAEARPLEYAKYSAVTAVDSAAEKSVVAEPPGELHEEAGPSLSRATGTSSVVGSTVAKPVDEARPPEITDYSGEQDMDACEMLRQADAVIKSINRSFSSACSCGDHGKKHTGLPTRTGERQILGG